MCELDLSTRQILSQIVSSGQGIVKDLIGHKLSKKRKKRLKDLENQRASSQKL